MSFFAVVLPIVGVFCVLEAYFPHTKLKKHPQWMMRVLAANGFRLALSALGALTWEHWFMKQHSIFDFAARLSDPVGGFVAYLVSTWIFYWWHRLRHENHWLWLTLHQFHHSPKRIEVMTSFYKHPFEMMSNTAMGATLVYPLLGLSFNGNGWYSIFSVIGEFFYHMNIRTPHWIGYVVQRPESHCAHHLRDRRVPCCNYSDLPLWDILGGTFYNPTEEQFKQIKTGFSDQKQDRITDMIACRDVVHPYRELPSCNRSVLALAILLIVGLSQSVGYMARIPMLRTAGLLSGSSPLPLVFTSYNGHETFSTHFEMTIQFQNGTVFDTTLDHKMYGALQGPYNRRNVYGAMLSHGPFFNSSALIQARDRILHRAMCSGKLLRELGLLPMWTARMFPSIYNATVQVLDRNNVQVGHLSVQCLYSYNT